MYIILGIVVLLVAIVYFVQYKTNPNEPPFVPGLPYFGVVFEYAAGPEAFYFKYHKKYGDIFAYYMMGTRYVSLGSPLPLPGLFRDANFSMEPLLEHLVWKAVGLPHGEQAHPESSRVNASLTGTPLQELTEKYTEYVDSYLKSIDSREWQTANLLEFTKKLMFNASVTALWGSDSEPEALYKPFFEWDNKLGMVASPMPELLLKRLIPDFYTNRDTIQNHFLKIIAKENKSELIKIRYECTEDPLIRAKNDHILLWGSQGNPCVAPFWAILHMWQNKALWNEISHETSEALMSGDIMTASRNMPNLNSLITEIIRFRGVSVIFRQALQSGAIEVNDTNYSFRKGDTFNLPAFALSFDEELFEDPFTFKADRFLEEKEYYKNGKKATKIDTNFGGGKTQCPGRFFFRNMMKVTVALLFKYLELEVLEEMPGYDKQRIGIGLQSPVSDVKFRYRKREQ